MNVEPVHLAVAGVSAVFGFGLGALFIRRSADYQDGLRKGIAEGRQHYSVVVTPFKTVNEGWFVNETAVGYEVQLLALGMPVGEPTRKIVEVQKTVDKERVDSMMKVALGAAQEAVKALIASRVRARLGGKK